MTVNLSKGQKVSLTKAAPGLNSVVIGLGWDPVKDTVKKGLFGFKIAEKAGADIDCDAFAVPFRSGTALGGEVLYFGRKRTFDGALVHTGDNLTGDGAGDDEQLIADLKRMPSDVDKIAIAVNIYNGKSRGQNFGKIDNAFIHIINKENNSELCKFNISNDPTYSRYVTMYFGNLVKINGEWEFEAVGEPHSAPDISSFVRSF